MDSDKSNADATMNDGVAGAEEAMAAVATELNDADAIGALNMDGTPAETNPEPAKNYDAPEALDFTGAATNELTETGLTKDADEDAKDGKSKLERPDEPLIPAAPVPGSLGSVISGPAKGTVVLPEPEPEQPEAEEKPEVPALEEVVAPEIPDELKMKVQDAPRPVDEMIAEETAEVETVPAVEPEPVAEPALETPAMSPELMNSISEMEADATAAKEAAAAASEASAAASQAASAASMAATEAASAVSAAAATMSEFYAGRASAEQIPELPTVMEQGAETMPEMAAMPGMATPEMDAAPTGAAMPEQMGMYVPDPASMPMPETAPMPEAMPMPETAPAPVAMPMPETAAQPMLETPVAPAPEAAPYYNPFAAPAAMPAEAASGTPGMAAPEMNTAPTSAAMPENLQPQAEKFSAKMPKERKPMKKVSIVTVILLGILALAAAALAVIFYIKWQNEAQKPVVNNPESGVVDETPSDTEEPSDTDTDAETPADDEPPVEQAVVTAWNCAMPMAAETAAGLENFVDGTTEMELHFSNDWLTDMTARLMFNFADIAAAEAMAPQFDLMVSLTAMIVDENGETPVTSSYELLGSTIIYTMDTDVLAASETEGLTVDLPRDEAGELVLDRETVVNYFASQGMSCAEVTVGGE